MSKGVSLLTILIDDGTSVLRVIIPNRLLKRADAEYLIPPYNVTLFGKVDLINNKQVIQCGGFQVEDNDASEMYHWIRAMQERPDVNSTPKEMFHTLSSLPSPKRLLRDNFLESPIKENNSKGFAWSPDHAFATSTPIRAVQVSPLRQRSDKFSSPMAKSTIRREDSDEFDDEFSDFGFSVDFDALENEALLMSATQNSNNKRKIDFANME